MYRTTWPDVVTDPERRHDFVLLLDVTMGNPNGDPDAGNLPRRDPETLQGWISDVSIKRKIRDWVDETHGTEERNKIYVQAGTALNEQHRRAYTALGIKPTGAAQAGSDVSQVRAWMAANFFDVRMFGGVMATQVNAGKLTGPVQLAWATSIGPITALEQTITRVSRNAAKDLEVEVGDDGTGRGGKETQIGRKSLVPYALYQGYGFYNPSLARRTGASREDLVMLWQALERMWDCSRSAGRALQSCRGLYVFSHDTPMGVAPAYELLERVRIDPQPMERPARAFGDYSVTVDESDLPKGITLTRLVA